MEIYASIHTRFFGQKETTFIFLLITQTFFPLPSKQAHISLQHILIFPVRGQLKRLCRMLEKGGQLILITSYRHWIPSADCVM